MNSLNKVQLIGNLTAEPEIRETPNGQKVANFSIATNRVWKDASGQKQEASDFHNVVAWTFLAELAEKYIEKGKKIYVEGRLSTRSWEADDGSKRYKTEIVAENIILLSSKSAADRDESFQDDAPEFDEQPRKKPAARKREDEIHIEDIPF